LSVTLFFAAALAAGACGQDRGGAPEGSPAAVVHGAADKTLAVHRARVVVDGPDGRHSEGVVDLPARLGTLTFTAPGVASASFPIGSPPPSLPAEFRRIEYTDPVAVIELVRHAEKIDPYGGLLVRGAGTVRYDVNIRLPGQEPFFADVYIDSGGRLRRLTVPEDRKDHRPKDRERRLQRLITVDLELP
jgi:hypothetical protein